LSQFSPILKADRVDDEVGVDMSGIAVSGHLHLMSGPCLHGELPCNVMGFLIADVLSGRKGLDILIEVDAVQFAMGSLSRFELQNGIHPITVDAADESLTRLPVECFVLSHAVPHDTSHGADVLPGFPDICYGSYAASPPRLMR
jgi:hypothetical protein